jgi:hypothetical protein
MDLRRRIEDVLEVVEHEQQLPLVHETLEGLLR